MNDHDTQAPDGDASDASELELLADKLRAARPVMRASARGDLRRHVERRRAGLRRPRAFRRRVCGFASVGLACMAFAGLSLVHVGPLQPPPGNSAVATASKTASLPASNFR